MPQNKDELLDFWKGEINRGLRFRKQFGLHDTWKTYRDYYRHNFPTGELNCNLVYASIVAESPSVMFNFPHITVTPTRPGYEAFAYVVEAVANRLAIQQDLQSECKDILVDVGTCGTGAVVIGYDSQYGYSQSDITSILGESFTQTSKEGYRLEYTSTVQRGMPWCLRVLPDDFLVPWGTSRFSDTPWFAFRFVRPLRDVQADEKYSKKARQAIQASRRDNVIDPPNLEGRFQEGGFPEELAPVFLWQVHDRRSGNVYVVSEGCEEFLRNEKDLLQTRLGLPAETLIFNKDPMWFWGIPEVRYYEGHQDEINEIIDQRRAFRKAALLRFVTLKGTIDEREKAKLSGGEPVLWIELDKPPSSDIRTVLQVLQPSIPPDFTEVKGDLREDIRELIGKSKPYMGEQLGKTHITKYETQTAMQQAGGRDVEKRERLARFIEKIMNKEFEIIFRHWNGKHVEQVIGPDLVPYWVEFTGSDLRSDYVIQVAVDEMAPVSRETKMAEAQLLMDMMAKDQSFGQMFPDAAMQVRKTILTLFPWLNFRQFEPREGVGGNASQPMDIRQFANAMPSMRNTSKGTQLPDANQTLRLQK